MSKNFYVTTPIYYVNGDPHVGSAYTTIAADVLARYKKTMGYDVFFLTGTDEHGQKVEETAKAKGYTPKDWCDHMAPQFIDMWSALNIDYDNFIRTTESRHYDSVKKILQKVYDNGDIYKGSYEGKYCISCETFVPENQVVGENGCPDCGKELTIVEEESYFFKMSAYQDRLLKHIEENPNFILPKSRRNEVISFIKQGLHDLSISRNTFSWGIPLEFDKGHITYVWFDALTNYLTAPGYENNPEMFDKFWNNSEVVHLLGKDILRFHAIIWPIMLMAAGEKLPEKVVAHGWWTVSGEKMSKSKGNVVNPLEEIKKYGVDAFRYFLLREVTFGNDGDYSTDAVVHRVNSDLANDLGNLLNRSLSMGHKYFDGTINNGQVSDNFDEELISLFCETVKNVEDAMERIEFSKALDSIWKFISRTNKYIDETMPWALAKDENEKARLETVVYNLIEALTKIAILVYPYVPESASKMWTQLGFTTAIESHTLNDVAKWGFVKNGHKINTGTPIFPRLELKPQAENKNEVNENLIIENSITIDDFNKIEIKCVEIVEVKPQEGSKNLLVFKVDTGSEIRQIVSGIAKTYKEPQELVGKKVMAILNLEPVELRGSLSQGMLLTVSTKKKSTLVELPNDTKLGLVVK